MLTIFQAGIKYDVFAKDEKIISDNHENRKAGKVVSDYLSNKYIDSFIFDDYTLECSVFSIIESIKLPSKNMTIEDILKDSTLRIEIDLNVFNSPHNLLPSKEWIYNFYEASISQFDNVILYIKAWETSKNKEHEKSSPYCYFESITSSENGRAIPLAPKEFFEQFQISIQL